MSLPYIGEIRIVPYSFAPVGWADCDGQLLLIAQNDALFALLGTTFGGDGQTTFALPDFRGRIGVGASQNPLGDAGGVETVSLNTSQIPSHSHSVKARTAGGTNNAPQNATYATLAAATKSDKLYGDAAGAFASSSAVSVTGGSQPHDNMQPYLAIRYIIALEGVFPPQ